MLWEVLTPVEGAFSCSTQLLSSWTLYLVNWDYLSKTEKYFLSLIVSNFKKHRKWKRKMPALGFCTRWKKAVELHLFCCSSLPPFQTDLNIQEKKHWHFSASSLSLPGSLYKHLAWIFLFSLPLTQNSYSLSLSLSYSSNNCRLLNTFSSQILIIWPFSRLPCLWNLSKSWAICTDFLWTFSSSSTFFLVMRYFKGWKSSFQL